jgi:hypothetical protein
MMPVGAWNFVPDYKWKEIADLPEDLDAFRDRELDSLFEVWRDEEKRLGEQPHIAALNKELARKWAIETGIIEGVYTLDRGITQILVERGIDSMSQTAIPNWWRGSCRPTRRY